MTVRGHVRLRYMCVRITGGHRRRPAVDPVLRMIHLKSGGNRSGIPSLISYRWLQCLQKSEPSRISSLSTSTRSSRSPLQTGQHRISMRSRFIDRRKVGVRLKPIARPGVRGPFQKPLVGASHREARALPWIPDNAYIGGPSWAQSPGGLSSLGRWERLAPHALADRRGPRVDLRRRAVPPRLLRRRRYRQPTERQLRHALHAARIRRIGLVLLAPRLVLFIPDGQGPRHGPDAELSVRPAESAAAAVPVVLPPRRPALCA